MNAHCGGRWQGNAGTHRLRSVLVGIDSTLRTFQYHFHWLIKITHNYVWGFKITTPYLGAQQTVTLLTVNTHAHTHTHARALIPYSKKLSTVKGSCPFPRHEGVWGSRSITPLILNIGARGRQVFNFTPRTIYFLEWSPGTHWTGRWLGPGTGMDVLEKR